MAMIDDLGEQAEVEPRAELITLRHWCLLGSGPYIRGREAKCLIGKEQTRMGLGRVEKDIW
jgi:hypothetical protein